MSLEAKVPPPLVALASAAFTWGIPVLAPRMELAGGVRLALCLAVVAAALVFSVGGVVSFRRARTTINPTTPEAASSLVSSGIYRITRNPMYVGLSLLLTAWAVFLSSVWALLVLVPFMLYISRFQIAPEERALTKLFAAEYALYKASVRRWL